MSERLIELLERIVGSSGPVASTLSASEWHELEGAARITIAAFSDGDPDDLYQELAAALGVSREEIKERMLRRIFGGAGVLAGTQERFPRGPYLVISCDNHNREGPDHDDKIIAQGIHDMELAKIMCAALNATPVAMISSVQNGGPRLERRYRVVASTAKLRCSPREAL